MPLPPLPLLAQCSSRQESCRKDLVSHHILRLAYCRTAELRGWLLQHEALLFKMRFRELDPQAQVCEAPSAPAAVAPLLPMNVVPAPLAS